MITSAKHIISETQKPHNNTAETSADQPGNSATVAVTENTI